MAQPVGQLKAELPPSVSLSGFSLSPTLTIVIRDYVLSNIYLCSYSLTYLPPPPPLSLPTAPGPVRGLTVSENLRVQWTRPDYPNGILTGYLVSVETYDEGVVTLTPETVDNQTLSYQLPNSSLGEWVVMQLSN